jgi:hypothetical protein
MVIPSLLIEEGRKLAHPLRIVSAILIDEQG